MSTIEHSPATFSQSGEIQAWTPPEVTPGTLADRLMAIQRIKAASGMESSDVHVDSEEASTSPEESDETSPIYDQMVAATEAETNSGSETAPDASLVERSSSRLAKLLRRGAEAADSSAERFDDIKVTTRKKLGAFGRAALRSSTATTEFALGASRLTADKALKVADRADDAFFDKAEAIGTKAKDIYGTTLDTATEKVANVGVSILDGKDKVSDTIDAVKVNVKERLATRKQAAIDRRQARRERWSARLTSAKESTTNALDRSAQFAMSTGAKLDNGMDIVGTKLMNGQEAVAGKIERTKTSYHDTRAIGRAMLEAARTEQAVRREQNKL